MPIQAVPPPTPPALPAGSTPILTGYTANPNQIVGPLNPAFTPPGALRFGSNGTNWVWSYATWGVNGPVFSGVRTARMQDYTQAQILSAGINPMTGSPGIGFVATVPAPTQVFSALQTEPSFFPMAPVPYQPGGYYPPLPPSEQPGPLPSVLIPGPQFTNPARPGGYPIVPGPQIAPGGAPPPFIIPPPQIGPQPGGPPPFIIPPPQIGPRPGPIVVPGPQPAPSSATLQTRETALNRALREYRDFRITDPPEPGDPYYLVGKHAQGLSDTYSCPNCGGERHISQDAAQRSPTTDVSGQTHTHTQAFLTDGTPIPDT
jgi:hypothetical protein